MDKQGVFAIISGGPYKTDNFKMRWTAAEIQGKQVALCHGGGYGIQTCDGIIRMHDDKTDLGMVLDITVFG